MIARLTLVALATLALTSTAEAQTYEGLAIEIDGRTIWADGGERGSAGASTGAVTIGNAHTAAFTQLPDVCGFGVSGRIASGAVGGWTVSVTPAAVEEEAVTFDVHWSRVPGPSASAAEGSQTFTLRPGESLPLDLVTMSPTLAYAYNECGLRATVLRVGVARRPGPARDSRVLATEMWLIERLADGSERTQALSLRGRPHEHVPFYFDEVTDAGVDFELYGDLAASVPVDHPGEFAVSVRARSRITEGGETSTILPVGTTPRGTLFSSRSVESELRFPIGEVVDVQLPRLTENSSGAFAGRTFWLRIRVRQIR